MIFYGKQHPLFVSYIEIPIIDKVLFIDAIHTHYQIGKNGKFNE